jgi:ADP-heptose:LPS heptosyltransferase
LETGSGTQQTSDIVLAQPGGLGDLVLTAELVGNLKRGLPGKRLTLICRSDVAPVVDLYPIAPDEIIRLPFRPYTSDRPAEFGTILRSIFARLGDLGNATFVDASLRSNWICELIASVAVPHTSIRCGLGSTRMEPLRFWLLEFLVTHRPIPTLLLPAGTHERDRYRLLADALGSRVEAPLQPWPLPPTITAEALKWLAEHNLAPRRYLVCAPGGAPQTPVKRWPVGSFRDAAQRFSRDTGWPVLLMGDQNEAALLTELGEMLADTQHAQFVGSPDDLPLEAGILSVAGAYLSNDAGLMHVAQAFDTPGVAIFGGGGEWPAYAPWAHGSVGLYHPLPCFGCQWDCFLGRGLCVESIPVEAVVEAIHSVLREPAGEPRRIMVKSAEAPASELIADASAQYREAQADRAARLDIIVELDRALRLSLEQQRELSTRLAAEVERVARVHKEAALRARINEEFRGLADASILRMGELLRRWTRAKQVKAAAPNRAAESGD